MQDYVNIRVFLSLIEDIKCKKIEQDEMKLEKTAEKENIGAVENEEVIEQDLD